MTDRTLLIWSRLVEKRITKELWNADRVIEVPDELSAADADQAAKRLASLVHEELSKAKELGTGLRVVPFGPPALQSVLEHVLAKVTHDAGGELVVLKVARRTENTPTVTLDHDTVSRVITVSDPDWKQPPLPDKSLYA